MVWVDKMIKIRVFVIALLMSLIIAPVAAIASVISDAQYYGIITVSNNSTATTQVSTNCTIGTQNWIDAYFLNSTANNTVLRNSSGADVPFMPGYAGNDWIMWVPSIGADGQLNYILYTANSSGGEIRYFPSSSGMTTTDDASLELGSSFEIEQQGYIDTSFSADKNLVYKQSAFRTYISAATDITSEVSGFSAYYSSNSDGHISHSGDTYNTVRTAASGVIDAGSATFTVGQNYYSTQETQEVTDSNENVSAVHNTRVGQRVNDFAGNISSVEFYFTKAANPVGTGYARVRKVSDDSIIGTLGSLDVATIVGAQWKTFNSTPVAVTETMDVRITFEYSGGDGINYVVMKYWGAGDITSFGLHTTFGVAGPWVDFAAEDLDFRISYERYQTWRGYVFFDTSPIPDGATIVRTDLMLYGSSDNATTDFNVQIQSGMPGSPNDPLQVGDYDQTNYAGDGGSITTIGWNLAGYNTIAFNATGMGWINDTGTTKLCLRSSRDIGNNSPAGNEYIGMYASEEAGVNKDPRLEVTYIAAEVTAAGITPGEHTITTYGIPDAELDFVAGNLEFVEMTVNNSPLDFTSEDFTIVVRTLDDADINDNLTMFGAGNYKTLGTGAGYWFLYDDDAANHKIKFQTTQASAKQITESVFNSIPYGGANTFGVTRSGAVCKVYWNGADITSVSGTHIDPAPFGVRNPQIGAIYDSGAAANVDYFNGDIDEVAVFNSQLDDGEMLAIHNMYNAGADRTLLVTSDLIALWRLGENAGVTTYDATDNDIDGTLAGGLPTWVNKNDILAIADEDSGYIAEDYDTQAGVPGNDNNWTFLQNDAMPYMEYHMITINGSLQQHIIWEYDSVFTDQSGNNNDATPTFRTASSDADVSAALVSFLPIEEAQAPAYTLGEAPPFISSTPNITGNFTITPPSGTFPLAGVIAAVANATSTPPQLPLLIIALFVTLAASLSVSAVMRRYGSGSLIVKMLAIAAFMGIFIALANFGIDFWMLVVFLIISVALAMASRQLGWT